MIIDIYKVFFLPFSFLYLFWNKIYLFFLLLSNAYLDIGMYFIVLKI
jgi:hypothetical protein